jgi:hypothetical protein
MEFLSLRAPAAYSGFAQWRQTGVVWVIREPPVAAEGFRKPFSMEMLAGLSRFLHDGEAGPAVM